MSENQSAVEIGMDEASSAHPHNIDGKHVISVVLSCMQMIMCATLAKRYVGIILLAAGLAVARIAELTGISRSCLYNWRKELQECDDIRSLFQVRGGGRKSSLAGIEDSIINEIENGAYSTRQQIADMIMEKFNACTSAAVVGKLLKERGIKCHKCGSLPAKADPEAQREFHDSILQPIISHAAGGRVALYFMDASHFVLGGDFLGRIYGSARRLVTTFSGRIRYNVLGAVNYATKDIVTVTNNTYITATQICDMLWKLHELHKGEPLAIVLDNASYQKCKIVTELAERLCIFLIYIPPYSPNLNLIERYWKFVKGKLRCKYYNDFAEFTSRIDDIIHNPNEKDMERINAIISNNFQLFDGFVQITENTYVDPNSIKKVA